MSTKTADRYFEIEKALLALETKMTKLPLRDFLAVQGIYTDLQHVTTAVLEANTETHLVRYATTTDAA